MNDCTSTTARGEALVHRLLARLDGVREVGPGRWLAKCPSHDDRSPSLSICELEDGRIFLYDFAGCEVDSILAAIGLRLSDLFPEHSERRNWTGPHQRACIFRRPI